jgi:hypothetical protein
MQTSTAVRQASTQRRTTQQRPAQRKPIQSQLSGTIFLNACSSSRDEEDLAGREQLTRIIIHSLLSLPDEGLAELVEKPARLGDSRWDALLQGLVAWRCGAAEPRVPVPAWAKETRLDEAWAPFGGSIRDDGWYTLSVLSTPAALLHRGIVLDHRKLKEL